MADGNRGRVSGLLSVVANVGSVVALEEGIFDNGLEGRLGVG
jgi:hypothetical protein